MAESIDNFMAFRSYLDTALAMDTDAERGVFLTRLLMYGLDGTEPEYTDKAMKLAFINIRPTIDDSRAKVINGSQGGRGNKKDRVKSPDETALNPTEDRLKASFKADTGEVKTQTETGLKPIGEGEGEGVGVEEREPLEGSLPPLEKDPNADGITDETANLSPIDCPECLGHETHRTDGIWECGKCGWRWRR